jgi:hypothetical protein
MKKEHAAPQAISSRSSVSGTNSSGTASVVFGILGLLLPAIHGLPLGITALIFGIVQQRSSASRWSVAGMILGVLSILFAILGFIYAPVLNAESLGGLA